jgi:hypothetical protein
MTLQMILQLDKYLQVNYLKNSIWKTILIGYTDVIIKIQIKKYCIINIWFVILVLNFTK